MVEKEKVLQFIRMNGPVIPVQLAKEICTDILLASAMLSELSSNGLVRISSIKRGSSPLYYVSGQEPKLQEYSNNLHEKEKKAYELLKQEKVLRDTALEPVERVAMREIKDFAKPLNVRIGDSEEIFWKWYMLPTPEAGVFIRKIVGSKTSSREETKPEEKEEPKQEKKDEEAKETEQKRIPPTLSEDSFLLKISSYLDTNKIEIIDYELIRKNSEIDLTLNIPSAVGKLTYYCKAKNKKRCSDSDLSSAYAKGNIKKLPVLFITTGELSKKAKGALETDYKSITVKKV